MLKFARLTTRFVNSVTAGPSMRTIGIETEERVNELYTRKQRKFIEQINAFSKSKRKDRKEVQLYVNQHLQNERVSDILSKI